MGLLTGMQPDGVARELLQPDRGEVALAVTVGQRAVARRVIVRRGLGPRVTSRKLTMAADGIVGYYYAPPGGGRHPAVLAFGGSEGARSPGAHSPGRWPPEVT